MDKFCAFCNQNNWKETKKKIKRDTEDKEAKRRRIEFTNLINASPETLKEKIVGKNVTIKELRKHFSYFRPRNLIPKHLIAIITRNQH